MLQKGMFTNKLWSNRRDFQIDEGVEVFEETMAKMNDANSDNQRDKLQDDLKKEIKKLQRLREQIKGWQGSPDIKVRIIYLIVQKECRFVG
jgi:CCR4-NOT transcriptional regulation complex NOT5 subunit